jgi:predicted enzyme related to lactoylglutathione lyase
MNDPMSPSATCLDFVSLQVRSLEATRQFYAERVGFLPAPEAPQGALVFQTQAGATFAVRTPLVDLEAVLHLGWGVSLWFAHADVEALCTQLIAYQVPILRPLADGPFGRMFTCADPDGYAVTFHQQK